MIDIGTSPDGWQLTFERAGKEGAMIQGIDVRRPSDGAVQRLHVEEIAPLPPHGLFRVGAEDLDSDGYGDLMLVTSRGVANTYAEYWRFDQVEGVFAELGTFPILQRQSGTGRLVAFERGGSGGFYFTRTEYAFHGGRLEIERVEEQTPVDDLPDRARRVVKERHGTELVTVVNEIVAAP